MVDTINATRDLSSDASSTDALNFFITKVFQDINTIILGKIIDVDNENKRLAVKSLINGVDSHKKPIDPPIIYDVPYGMIRGGSAGIIIEYKVGDNVIIGFCQRQIDSTKSTQSQSTPALYRMFSLQDAVILSCWSNTDPSVFIKITDDEITMQGTSKPITINTTGNVNINGNNVNVTATSIAKIQAAEIQLDGPIVATDTLTIGETILNAPTGSVIDAIPFLLHTHGGVTTGTGTTGPVTP